LCKCVSAGLVDFSFAGIDPSRLCGRWFLALCAQWRKVAFLGLGQVAFSLGSCLALCRPLCAIVHHCAFPGTLDEAWWVEVEVFLWGQWFLALTIKYAVWCRGMMLLGSLRFRINMLRLNILHKPVPHCIQHCAPISDHCCISKGCGVYDNTFQMLE